MSNSAIDSILPILPILIQLAEDEILKRMNQGGKTRDEVLAEATTAWQQADQGADDLAKLGHE